MHAPYTQGNQCSEKLTDSSSGLTFGWSRIHLLLGSLLVIGSNLKVKAGSDPRV